MQKNRARLSASLVAAALVVPLVPATIAATASGAVPTATTVAAKPATKPSKAQKRRSKPVTVMSRNIYLGADIFRPVKAADAAAGQPLDQVLHAVATAADQTWSIVEQTRFPVRARLLAREIKQTKPALVGLQEVALWRTGPFEMDKLAQPNATEVEYDFLEILLAELARRGQQYRAVVVGNRADVEAPAWDATGANRRDIRLTMHDVILLRRGSVKVLDKGDALFENNLDVKLGGFLPMNFDRGYQWVDVKAGKRRFRFVNTHLEAASSDLALAQAHEVVDNAVRTDRTTVMVCDCNSDPLDDHVKATDTVPHRAAYDFLVGTGLVDQWLQWRPAEQGWTSGLSETVDDATPAGFDHRIDLVLVRTPSGRPLEVKRGWVTGDELADRDAATGLWPSDHAGVVLRLKGLRR